MLCLDVASGGSNLGWCDLQEIVSKERHSVGMPSDVLSDVNCTHPTKENIKKSYMGGALSLRILRFKSKVDQPSAMKVLTREQQPSDKQVALYLCMCAAISADSVADWFADMCAAW